METCPISSCFPSFDPSVVIKKKTRLPECSHYKGGEVKQYQSSPTFNVQQDYRPTSYMDALVNGHHANPSHDVAPFKIYEDDVIERKDYISSVKSSTKKPHESLHDNQIQSSVAVISKTSL